MIDSDPLTCVILCRVDPELKLSGIPTLFKVSRDGRMRARAGPRLERSDSQEAEMIVKDFIYDNQEDGDGELNFSN